MGVAAPLASDDGFSPSEGVARCYPLMSTDILGPQKSLKFLCSVLCPTVWLSRQSCKTLSLKVGGIRILPLPMPKMGFR